MKVSKVGLLSFACNPSRTLIQSSSPVCAKTAHRPSAESTHADPFGRLKCISTHLVVMPNAQHWLAIA